MNRIVLPALFDLPAAMALQDTLRADAGPTVLDASRIDRIGVAGLQLLLSAHATAAATGRSLALDAPSAALCAAARTAGAGFLVATER